MKYDKYFSQYKCRSPLAIVFMEDHRGINDYCTLEFDKVDKEYTF